jgi:hypothetical protein
VSDVSTGDTGSPRALRSRRALLPHALFLLILSLGATLLLTWPLALHARDRLPDTNIAAPIDSLVAGWLLAYEAHALVTAPRDITAGNIFHPSPHAIFYGPLGLGALPIFAPIFIATGNTTLALNVLYLAGVALTAWSMALVVRLWTGSLAAACGAASTLLASQWLMRGMVATAPFAAALFYLPFIIYLAAVRTRTVRESLWLVPLLVLQCLDDLVYIAPAVLAPLGVLAVVRFARARTRRSGIALATAIVLTLVVMSPMIAGYVAVRRENPNLAQQTFWPPPLGIPPAFGQLFSPASARAVPVPIAVLIVALGIAFVSRARGRPLRRRDTIWVHGALWFVVGVVLSLPRVVVVWQTVVPSPLGIVARWVPPLALARTTDRLGLAALMGSALLAGAATAETLRLLRGRRSAAPAWREAGLAAGVGIAAYLGSGHADPARSYLPRNYPLFAPPRWSDGAVAVLRAAPGSVVELPFPSLEKTMPRVHARAMYRSTGYWRPLINGHHSYYPADFAARVSWASRLPDPQAIEVLRDTADLSLIAVPLDDLAPSTRLTWQIFAAHPPRGLRLAFQSRHEMIFAVLPRGGEPQGRPTRRDLE